MIVFPIHLLASPLAPLLAVLDAYVLTAACYLIAGRVAAGWRLRWHPTLRRVITAPAMAVQKRLARRRRRSVPSWQPWAVVFAAAIVVRQLLAAVIMSTL